MTRMTDEEKAKEAKYWESKEASLAGWEDAPDAPPRATDSEAISIRMPNKLLVILKEFAKRQGVGYQVLIKQWLDARVFEEREKLRAKLHKEREEKAKEAKKVVQFPQAQARKQTHKKYQLEEHAA
jgi:hypothetical protein